MSFHQPSVWFLLALLPLPLAWWRWTRWRRRRAIVFSSVRPLLRPAPSLAVRLAWVVPALRSGAIILLAVALARPQVADEHTRVVFGPISANHTDQLALVPGLQFDKALGFPADRGGDLDGDGVADIVLTRYVQATQQVEVTIAQFTGV